MKLFVKCAQCNYKIYITSQAQTRQQLPSVFELTCLNCHTRHHYYPHQVCAESGLNAIGGALLGGLLGLALGAPGALAGAILGGALGKSTQTQDDENVRRFNNS